MCGHGYTICRWIYTCVSPYLQNGYTQVEKKNKKKINKWINKKGLQSIDINHITNLESDSKHQHKPTTPTGDNVMPSGSTNLENTNKRVFGLHDECE